MPIGCTYYAYHMRVCIILAKVSTVYPSSLEMTRKIKANLTGQCILNLEKVLIMNKGIVLE